MHPGSAYLHSIYKQRCRCHALATVLLPMTSADCRFNIVNSPSYHPLKCIQPKLLFQNKAKEAPMFTPEPSMAMTWYSLTGHHNAKSTLIRPEAFECTAGLDCSCFSPQSRYRTTCPTITQQMRWALGCRDVLLLMSRRWNRCWCRR